VLAADGVAQAPTLAALLAPNTLPTFGISNAPPTPPTTATAPTIARSRVRDRGSNLRSWLKTLLLYDTTPFPFNRVYRSRAITVALPLCRFTQNQDFLIFARTAVIPNSEESSVSAGQGLVDQGKRESVKTPPSDRNNFVRNGGRGGPSAGYPQITPGSTIAQWATLRRPLRGRCAPRRPPTPSSCAHPGTRTAPPPGSTPRPTRSSASRLRGTFHAERAHKSVDTGHRRAPSA
jgi:hypothetical protein